MNSLIANYGTSSEDSDSSYDSDSDDLNKCSNNSDADNQNDQSSKPKLPTPSFGTENKVNTSQNSVFKNPFTEAETSKEAALQKHVKMVENKDNTLAINGRKICWNYRKGRCRFGHNCKFAHDSDVALTKEQLEHKNSVNQFNAIIKMSTDKPPHLLNESNVEEDESPVRKKSKRPGLTQGLKPGKKVMRQYLKNHRTGI